MSKKDHIEEAFKEGFKNFEAPVDPSVWAGVRSGLSGSAGAAGAGGMSIAKMIVIGVSAIAAVSVGVALYISSADDSAVSQKSNPQQQVVEETSDKKVIPAEETLEQKEDNQDQEKIEEESPQPSNHEGHVKPENNNEEGNNNSPQNNAGNTGSNTPSPDRNTPEHPESSNNQANNNNNATADNQASDNPKPQNNSNNNNEEELSLSASVNKQEGFAPLTVNFEASSNGDVTWQLRDEAGNVTSYTGPLHEVELEKPGSYFISCTSKLGDVKDYQEFAVNVKSNFSCSIDASLLDFEGGIVLTPNGFDKKELKFNCSNIQDVEVFSMVVMNGRTQEKVFETHRIEDMNWNGKDASDVTLEKGTYFVVIFIGTKDGETIDPIKKRLIIR